MDDVGMGPAAEDPAVLTLGGVDYEKGRAADVVPVPQGRRQAGDG